MWGPSECYVRGAVAERQPLWNGYRTDELSPVDDNVGFLHTLGHDAIITKQSNPLWRGKYILDGIDWPVARRRTLAVFRKRPLSSSWLSPLVMRRADLVCTSRIPPETASRIRQ